MPILHLDHRAPAKLADLGDKVGLDIIKDLDCWKLELLEGCNILSADVDLEARGEYNLLVFLQVLKELHPLHKIVFALGNDDILLSPPVGCHGKGLADVVHCAVVGDERRIVFGQEPSGQSSVENGVEGSLYKPGVESGCDALHYSLLVVRVGNDKLGLKVQLLGDKVEIMDHMGCSCLLEELGAATVQKRDHSLWIGVLGNVEHHQVVHAWRSGSRKSVSRGGLMG